jgi:hypothetical protein
MMKTPAYFGKNIRCGLLVPIKIPMDEIAIEPIERPSPTSNLPGPPSHIRAINKAHCER